MPRLAARSAGNLVQQRAAEFSAALLEAEQACLDAIDRRFTSAAPLARTATRAAWRRAGGQPGLDQRLRTDLAALAADALVSCRPDVTRLLRVGTDLALESISDELGYCEATLPDRHAGTAQAGVAAAEEHTTALTDTAAAGYTSAEPGMLAGLDAALIQQLTLSARWDEASSTLLARLTRPEPGAGTPGLTGRGIWYRPATAAQAQARASVIGLVNAVREAAMAGMNAAAPAN